MQFSTIPAALIFCAASAAVCAFESPATDPATAIAKPPPRTPAPALKAAGPAANTTLASWYGGGEKLSRRTASGEAFNPDALTAAHRTLPIGARLHITANGRSVIVRINDRGPSKSTGRSLDVSRGAARALDMIGRGTARVTWRVVGS